MLLSSQLTQKSSKITEITTTNNPIHLRVGKHKRQSLPLNRFNHHQRLQSSIQDQQYTLQSKQFQLLQPISKRQQNPQNTSKSKFKITKYRQRGHLIAHKLAIPFECMHVLNAFSSGKILRTKQKLVKNNDNKPITNLKRSKTQNKLKNKMDLLPSVFTISDKIYNISDTSDVHNIHSIHSIHNIHNNDRHQVMTNKYNKNTHSKYEQLRIEDCLKTDLQFLTTNNFSSHISMFVLKLNNQQEIIKKQNVRNWLTFPNQNAIFFS